MGIRIYKPTSAGRASRFGTRLCRRLTHRQPRKEPVRADKKNGGRNHSGMMTTRHTAAALGRIYRVIDFKRNKDGVPAKVATVEYDPNRNCFISLLHYADGEKRYILAPVGIKVGDMVESGLDVEPKTGNAMPLAAIPVALKFTI